MVNKQFKLDSISVVVRGAHHNPSILNADFLRIQKILPAGMKENQNETQVSPFLSRLQYPKENFTMEVNPRFLTCSQQVEDVKGNLCCSVARKYVRTLPRVRYNAVGVNFGGTLPVNKSVSLVDCFIKSGTWTQFRGSPLSANMQFSYVVDDKRIIIALSGSDNNMVSLAGNIHREINEIQDSWVNVEAILDEWMTDWDDFQEVVRELAKGL